MSFNRDDNITPATIMAGMRNHSSGVNILNESRMISAISAPAPTECNDFFQRKVMIVTTSDKMAVAIINDLKNPGIGNLDRMYDEDP